MGDLSGVERPTLRFSGRGAGVPSVSSLYADALAGFLEECGLQASDIGGVPGSRGMGGKRVGGSMYAHTLSSAARLLGDNTLGLRFGSRVGAAGFGMLGIAAATAPTLGESIRHLTQLESITSTLGRASVWRHGARVSLVWKPNVVVPPAVVEGILAGWVCFGRYLLAEQVDVLQVSLTHGPESAFMAYDETFACPVRFGAPQYGVTLNADLLDARPRFADPVMNASLNGWLGHCAAAVGPDGNTLTRTTAALLATRLADGDTDESAVAVALGMGRRAFQRALQEENSSFRQILNATRAQHAIIGLLRSDNSLLTLCGEVGFNEQSSLCRAFHRWTGHAPLTFKQRLGAVYHPLRA